MGITGNPEKRSPRRFAPRDDRVMTFFSNDIIVIFLSMKRIFSPAEQCTNTSQFNPIN